MDSQPLTIPGGPCWNWQGTLTKDGYGRIRTIVNRGKLAHRVSYQAFNGPIPDHLTVDHLCRNRRCVNPWHLEIVTKGENARRGLKGFDLTGRCTKGLHEIQSEADIYYVRSHGVLIGRGCRLCRNERERRGRRRRLGLD